MASASDQGYLFGGGETLSNWGRLKVTDQISLTVANSTYSKSEKMLFKFLPKNGNRISSQRLVEMKKKVDAWSVVHPRNNITVTMRNLMEKVKDNREGFEIKQSKRRGPHSIEYWIEVKKGAAP
jgi:oligoribonuclease NrnB/cAMP/cGMP phosphodiesterase (DHH superfamily)